VLADQQEREGEEERAEQAGVAEEPTAAEYSSSADTRSRTSLSILCIPAGALGRLAGAPCAIGPAARANRRPSV